jgi:hypothetical protein
MMQIARLQTVPDTAHLEYPDHFASRVHHGVIIDRLEHGTVFATQSQRLLVPNDLLASTDAITPPENGTTQLISLLSSRDPQTGYFRATRRGSPFITGVFERHYPGCVAGAWDGASHSWGILKMTPEHKAAWLELGGTKMRAMQAMLGLKRLSIFATGNGNSPEEIAASEFRNIITCIWTHARIVAFDGASATIKAPHNPPQVRGALAVLAKIMPHVAVKVV